MKTINTVLMTEITAIILIDTNLNPLLIRYTKMTFFSTFTYMIRK